MSLTRANLRALAFYRIAIGIYLLFDLALRWIDSPILYDPILLGAAQRELNFSLMRATANLQTLPLLWSGIAAFYLLFLMGYRTRIFHALSLVAFTSLLAYNPHCLYEGDALVAFSLLWALFLPLGARLSLDARKHPAAQERIRSWGAAAFKLQVMVMLAVSALWKLTNPDHDWTYGTALYYGSRYDCTAWGLMHWVQAIPFPLTKVLTWWVLGVSCLAPFLLWKFDRTPAQRRGAIGSLILVYALLCSSLYVGALFWVVFACLWVFVEPGDWGWDRFFKPGEGTVFGRSRGAAWGVLILGYVNFFTLAHAYEYVLRPLMSDEFASVYYALKPVRLVNLNAAIFPPQYWRIHGFTPRFDTTFFFEGITREGRSIDVSAPFGSRLAWAILTSPRAIRWEPQHDGRIYDRLVYNFLWHAKKVGNPQDRAALGEWLRSTYQSKFPGLILDRIVWHDWMEVTPPPGSETPAQLIKEIAQVWDWRVPAPSPLPSPPPRLPGGGA